MATLDPVEEIMWRGGRKGQSLDLSFRASLIQSPAEGLVTATEWIISDDGPEQRFIQGFMQFVVDQLHICLAGQGDTVAAFSGVFDSSDTLCEY